MALYTKCCAHSGKCEFTSDVSHRQCVSSAFVFNPCLCDVCVEVLKFLRVGPCAGPFVDPVPSAVSVLARCAAFGSL